MPAPEPFVIVGGGLAGAKAAETLRAEEFDGPIVLVGEEPEAPYERPPLSKDYLRGESPSEKARVHPTSPTPTRCERGCDRSSMLSSSARAGSAPRLGPPRASWAAR